MLCYFTALYAIYSNSLYNVSILTSFKHCLGYWGKNLYYVHFAYSNYYSIICYRHAPNVSSDYNMLHWSSLPLTAGCSYVASSLSRFPWWWYTLYPQELFYIWKDYPYRECTMVICKPSPPLALHFCKQADLIHYVVLLSPELFGNCFNKLGLIPWNTHHTAFE